MFLIGFGTVQGVQSRGYSIFEPHDITIYVHTDITWANMSFYVWDNNDTQFSGNWPGKRVNNRTDIGGKRWYYQSYQLTSPEQYLNLVVTNTSGNRQTVDITGIRSDCYLCITGEKDGEGKYTVEDQTDNETGIIEVHSSKPKVQVFPYDLNGRKILSPKKKKGIIIEEGRKVAYK